MKKMLPLFLCSLILPPHLSFAVDVGDGRDGTCAVVGPAQTLIAPPKVTYQCTSVVIDGNIDAFNGTQLGINPLGVLTIKSQGLVTINAGVTFDLSGAAGTDGVAVGPVATGGQAGAGGSKGGNSTLTNGQDGGGAGKGTGGNYSPYVAGANDIGGGGGGGSYGTVSGTVAVDGDSNGSIITAGSNGGSYGPEINFESAFSGGSGGGAGGSGNESTPTFWTGSAGGGGGGAIHIVSGGNIIVDGNISANGGNGGGSGVEVASGGGGGGSGGAIWIQAQGTLTINGVLSVAGGIHGTNATGFLGVGGDGGNGRIRLDDADGVIAGGSVPPAAVSQIFVPTAVPVSGSSALSRQYTSSISCAKVSLDKIDHRSIFLNLLLGFSMASLFYWPLFGKRKL